MYTIGRLRTYVRTYVPKLVSMRQTMSLFMFAKVATQVKGAQRSEVIGDQRFSRDNPGKSEVLQRSRLENPQRGSQKAARGRAWNQQYQRLPDPFHSRRPRPSAVPRRGAAGLQHTIFGERWTFFTGVRTYVDMVGGSCRAQVGNPFTFMRSVSRMYP